MNFSAEDFRDHVVALDEALQVAGAPRVAEIEEGQLHMSFHFQSVGPAWWDVPARGSVAYAVITENQPEELLGGRPWNTLRRSNVVQVHGWTVYFFPDGEKIYTANGRDMPECYRNAITQWLTKIRNPDGEGAAANGPIR